MYLESTSQKSVIEKGDSKKDMNKKVEDDDTE